MKRLLLMICALALFADASAQLAGRSALKFVHETWDFGSIREKDGKVSHTFEFTNVGATPLVIENVSASCGCTTPEYTREPVLPGRKGRIRVTFDPEGRPGVFNKEVYVTAVDRTSRNTLTITGSVEGRPRSVADDYPIPLSPSLRVGTGSLNFGFVRRGSVKSMTIPCVNTSKSGTIGLAVDMPVRAPYFKVHVPSQLKPGQRGEITLTYDLDAGDAWGMLSNRFSVLVDGERAPMPIAATAVAVEDFSHMTPQETARAAKAMFETQFFNLGDVRRGEVRTLSVRMTNSGHAPLIVRAVNNSRNATCGVQPGETVAPGKTAAFTITFTADTSTDKRVYQSIILILNDPSRPMRELRLVGNLID
ncbi:MAG: DUF1573 domain-containing protein [Rikenellaceae bacterium]|nr:DUF1573 domain-containing protein [Rikenellaceae bacterium]